VNQDKPTSINDRVQELLNKKIEEIKDDSIFIEKPVSPKTFFTEYMKQPLFPIQQEAVDNILVTGEGKESKWNTQYNEAYLLWGEGCFLGDTKIALLNGEDVPIKELVEKYGEKPFWVYSIDLERGLVPGKASNARLTKYVESYLAITLDNGEVVKCTEDHPFLLRTGIYRKAKELVVGDSLMPLYRYYNREEQSIGEYEYIYDPIIDKMRKTHKMVKWHNTLLTHHIDRNSRNNEPDNLSFEDPTEHSRYHTLLLYQDPTFKEKMSKIYNSNEYKLKMAKSISTSEKHQQFVEKSRTDEYREMKRKEKLNHKIINIVTHYGKEPVYDITVEEYHNFALSSGVFVHNSGKSLSTSRMWTYAIYWILCLKNPQLYFELGISTEPIDLVNVSFDEDQAQFVFFKKLKTALASTIDPKDGKNWFEKRGMKIKETSKAQIIEFPKHITAYSLNSREYKAEGKNILMAVFDEMAVFRPDKARELYKNLKGSMLSRFPTQHKFVAISYKRDDYDYMMVRWDETKNDPNIYRSGPYWTWEVNLTKKQADFKNILESNPEDSERRYGCRGKTAQSGYFKYREKIKEGINKDRISPVMEETIPIREIARIRFHEWFKGERDSKYVVHIDLAKGKDTQFEKADCCGFALGHKIELEEDKSKVIIDLMLQIKALPGKEIIFEEIRAFIYGLGKIQEFNIEKVTLDGFQSTDFLQILRSKGIMAELLSVDRDASAYDTMKSLIYNSRLDYYGYPVFIRELEELILINSKVDHPEISRRRALEEKDDRGSKDVSDAVAGVCKNLIAELNTSKPATKWLPVTDAGKFGQSNTNEKPQDPNSREYGSNYKVNDEEDD